MRRMAWALNGIGLVLLALWLFVSPIYALPFWVTIGAMVWCDRHVEPRRRLLLPSRRSRPRSTSSER